MQDTVFAIPTSIMTKVIADLKQYGTVQRALLGIRGGSIGSSLMDDRQPIDKSGKTLADKAKELGVVEGVWVSEIVENGSAAGADIKVDDVIIGVDNKKYPIWLTCRKHLLNIVRVIR